jgi:hypothetical protein
MRSYYTQDSEFDSDSAGYCIAGHIHRVCRFGTVVCSSVTLPSIEKAPSPLLTAIAALRHLLRYSEANYLSVTEDVIFYITVVL